MGSSSPSVLSELCQECISTLREVLATSRSRLTQPLARDLDKSLSRMILWSDSHGIVEGLLDKRVDESKLLRQQVLGLLTSIAHILSGSLVPILKLGKVIDTERIDQLVQGSCAATLGDGSETDHHRSHQLDDSSDASFDLLAISVDELEVNTEYLIELEAFIQTAPKDSAQGPQASSSDPFLKRIELQFPSASSELVVHLAGASLARWERLRAARSENSTIGNQADIRESQVTIDPLAQALDDTTSLHEDSSLRSVPTLSLEAKHGRPFDCVACGRLCWITSDFAWKKHLLEDLQPWICPQVGCSHGNKAFANKQDWAEHLRLQHSTGTKWSSFACPFCAQLLGGRGNEANIHRHLSSHLQDLALDALPNYFNKNSVRQVPEQFRLAFNDSVSDIDSSLEPCNSDFEPQSVVPNDNDTTCLDQACDIKVVQDSEGKAQDPRLWCESHTCSLKKPRCNNKKLQHGLYCIKHSTCAADGCSYQMLANSNSAVPYFCPSHNPVCSRKKKRRAASTTSLPSMTSNASASSSHTDKMFQCCHCHMVLNALLFSNCITCFHQRCTNCSILSEKMFNR